MIHRFTRLACCLLLMLLAAWTTFARSESDDKADKGEKSEKIGEGVVNKLFGPGPLMEGHKDLEHGDCLKCHDAGQGVPDPKCLSCHTDIQKSVKEKNTFHGLTKQPCIGCHNDHKGRTYNSTAVNQTTFKHALTGFALHGAHAKLSCAKCHTEKRTSKPIRQSGIRYFSHTETCNTCHKKDDIHHFPTKWAAKECSTCHTDTSWKGATFDHKKETGYALIGEHAKLKCATCHTPKGKPVKYEFPELKAQACLTCHVDFHKDKFDAKFRGGNCDKCHSQTTWKLPNFDHNTTGFPLKEAHAKVACIGCHKQAVGVGAKDLKNFKFSGLATECVSCHLDYHGFRAEKSPKLGVLTQCATCHNETSWKSASTFNHNTQTNYPITGKHIGVKCFLCHVPVGSPTATVEKKKVGQPNTARQYEFPGLDTKTCELCHKSPHKDSNSPSFRNNKCSTCHTTDGWMIFGKGGASGMGGAFNHDTMTRFPLTGDHTKISCNSCHLKAGKQVYKFAGAEKQFCETCHKTPHKDQFDEKFLAVPCSDCHNTTLFKDVTKFNHNDSRFHITGAHQKLANDCKQCHKPTGKTLPGVKPPRPADKFLFEHPDTGFCIDCHKNIHKEQFDETFRSDNCLTCHNVQKWTDLSSFDHDKTRFRLTGSHQKIKNDCGKCHIKTNKMLATNPPKAAAKFKFGHADNGFCEACHKNVHVGQFTEDFAKKPCKECHSVINWEKRLPFDHDTTPFKLTGAHLKLKDTCIKCHVKTEKTLATNPPKPASQFQFSHGKDGYCEACHQNEHKGQFHDKFATSPCVSCHFTTDFAHRNKFDHHLARFDLKGKHIKVKCVDCHKPTEERFKVVPHHFKDKFIFPDLLTKDCELCHKDPHAGRFGKQCSTCHTEEGWDKTADFHKDFVLSGVHNLLECTECHVDKRQLTGMGNDCKMCHQKDDVHMGTQPDCASCHLQQFWSMTSFKHSLTDFPLRGAHRLLECSECHFQGVYEGKDPDCISCHLDDALKVQVPPHTFPNYQQCDQCHNQFLFKVTKRN